MGLPTMALRPTITARWPASGTPLRLQQLDDAGAASPARSRARPSQRRPTLTGWKPSTSLAGAMRSSTRRSWICGRQRELDQDAVDRVVGVELVDEREQLAPRRASAGRRSVRLSHADLGAALHLALDVDVRGRVVADQHGGEPRRARRRRRSSSRTPAATSARISAAATAVLACRGARVMRASFPGRGRRCRRRGPPRRGRVKPAAAMRSRKPCALRELEDRARQVGVGRAARREQPADPAAAGGGSRRGRGARSGCAARHARTPGPRACPPGAQHARRAARSARVEVGHVAQAEGDGGAGEAAAPGRGGRGRRRRAARRARRAASRCELAAAPAPASARRSRPPRPRAPRRRSASAWSPVPQQRSSDRGARRQAERRRRPPPPDHVEAAESRWLSRS